MAKKKDNQTIYLIGLGILILIAIGSRGDTYMTEYRETKHAPLEPEKEFYEYEVKLEVEPANICSGDSTTGSIYSNIEMGFCSIFVDTGSGMTHYKNVLLDENGEYSEAQTIYATGTAEFRAVCCDVEGNCRISNDARVFVDDCIDDEDEDDETDEDGYTCGDTYSTTGVCDGTCPEGQSCIEYMGIQGWTCECKDEQIPEQTPCSSVILPEYGDLGGICYDEGYCSDTAETCSHYWDYITQEHKCGCTENFYCGQYCYEYFYTNGCICPPNSHQVWLTKSTYECEPDGCQCYEGEVNC